MDSFRWWLKSHRKFHQILLINTAQCNKTLDHHMDIVELEILDVFAIWTLCCSNYLWFLHLEMEFLLQMTIKNQIWLKKIIESLMTMFFINFKNYLLFWDGVIDKIIIQQIFVVHLKIGKEIQWMFPFSKTPKNS